MLILLLSVPTHLCVTTVPPLIIGPLFTERKMSRDGFFSGPYFLLFGINTEIYSVNLRIQSECGIIRIRKNPVFGHFSSRDAVSLDIQHPIPFCMQLFVLSLDFKTESKKGYCRFSNFVSTPASLPWNFCLESFFIKHDPCVFNARICCCCCCRYLTFICVC